jgi:hypothetical protein
MKSYIITVLATALISSFCFISYQHFFTFKTLQQEKVDIKRTSDSVILVITNRPTYSSSVETKNTINAKKSEGLVLGQENKASQENNLKDENKDSKKKK